MRRYIMSEGKIIVIEGCESVGKETQSQLLVEKLKEKKIPAILFSFPNYQSPTGRIFKDCVLEKEERKYFKEGYHQIDPKVVCLYTAADRKYNSKEILSYKEKGYIVVLNRYTSSNMAYQGSKIEDADERFYMYQWIDKLEYWLLALPKPDQTIFLKTSKEYLKNKEQEKTLEAYQELSELYHWDIIDCIQAGKRKTIHQIHEEILEKIC